MIEVKGISKEYGGIKALNDITFSIQEGVVFGLIGTNGAGKSTFLRALAGILRTDNGMVEIDEENVYENEEVKRNIFFISDEQYFFANATVNDMKNFYIKIYPLFDEIRFTQLISQFGLDGNRKINTFSKGMKKQVSVIIGICANTKYILCDETFDGYLYGYCDSTRFYDRRTNRANFEYAPCTKHLLPVLLSHSNFGSYADWKPIGINCRQWSPDTLYSCITTND